METTDFPDPGKEWKENATKRFAGPFIGKDFDRVNVDPVLLAHAAPYCGFTLKEFYTQPKLGARAVIWAHEAYDLIPVVHWWPTIHVWSQELGTEFEWRTNSDPMVKKRAVKGPEDVERLEVPDAAEIKKTGKTFLAFKECFDYVAKNYPDWLVPLYYGFQIETNAAELLGSEDFLVWTYKEKDLAHKLIRKALDTSLNACQAIVETYGGALIVTGAALAGTDLLPNDKIKEFGVDYCRELVKGALRRGAGPQVWYHLCGNHAKDWELWEEVPFTPFTVFQVGYKGRQPFPLTDLIKKYGRKATIMGNVDTKVVHSGTSKEVYEMQRDQILVGLDNPNGFISGCACELPANTPSANITAMVRAANDVGRFNKR